MKLMRNKTMISSVRSLPSRERGLKYYNCRYKQRNLKVAPLAGAWIEIYPVSQYISTWGKVAPLAGAWIEIEKIGNATTNATVAPLAGAWIEIRKCKNGSWLNVVAPLAGAWIEIKIIQFVISDFALSLPSRERGLKFEEYSKKGGRIASLPSRERGLKYCQKDAYKSRKESLPSRERGLKSLSYASNGICTSRSPRGSVD